MKTRDRILLTSQDLFNLCGEPNVTTIDIANEMEISPGNLYYHFRNKDEIVFELFQTFENGIYEVLQTPLNSNLEMMDYWMFVHLVLEKIWEYRFLYRDSATLLERNNKLQKRFNRILDKKKECCLNVITILTDLQAIKISPIEAEKLATSMVITGTFWLNYQHIRNMASSFASDELGQGVYQIMSLFTPYLSAESRDMLEAVADTYLGETSASI